MSAPGHKENFILYRHFDAAGRLLYVGVSIAVLTRIGQHRQKSEWFRHVTRIELERFASRAGMIAAERRAIENEKPERNVVHARPDGPCLTQDDLLKLYPAIKPRTLRMWIRQAKEKQEVGLVSALKGFGRKTLVDPELFRAWLYTHLLERRP